MTDPATKAGGCGSPDHDNRYCHGPKRDGSGPCHRPPGWGTPHPGIGRCKLHGGSTSSHVKNAAARQARDMAARSLLGGPHVKSVTDPVGFAQELLGRLRHAVEVLDWLVGLVTDGDGNPVALSAGQLAVIRELVPVLREARRLATDLARLRLEDRAVAVLEAQVEQMGLVEDAILEGMLRGVLLALADHGEAVRVVERRWPELVGEVVPREWRALEAKGGKG